MKKRVDCVGEIARLNRFSFSRARQKEPNIFAINHSLYFYLFHVCVRLKSHIHPHGCLFSILCMILINIFFCFCDRLPNVSRTFSATAYISNIREYFSSIFLSESRIEFTYVDLVANDLDYCKRKGHKRISWINDFMLVCLLICLVLCRRQITLFLLIIAITHRSKLHMDVCKFSARQSLQALDTCWS